MLESLNKCEEERCYKLVWPAGWIGGLKFKLVSQWGEAGASLYHKLRDGLEEGLASVASEKVNDQGLSEQSVTLRESDEGTYIIDKVEFKRVHRLSKHKFDWSHLIREAKCHRRTIPPPTHHLFIKGHAKSEGRKLASVTASCSSSIGNQGI